MTRSQRISSETLGPNPQCFPNKTHWSHMFLDVQDIESFIECREKRNNAKILHEDHKKNGLNT